MVLIVYLLPLFQSFTLSSIGDFRFCHLWISVLAELQACLHLFSFFSFEMHKDMGHLISTWLIFCLFPSFGFD